jgi:F0F1-type ATP synthase membrane subunit c/vacuolar-type H+-ATPase subunit K
MNGAVAGNAAGKQFAAVINKTAQHSLFFKIYIINLIIAEAANFLSSHDWHILIPFIF